MSPEVAVAPAPLKITKEVSPLSMTRRTWPSPPRAFLTSALLQAISAACAAGDLPSRNGPAAKPTKTMINADAQNAASLHVNRRGVALSTGTIRLYIAEIRELLHKCPDFFRNEPRANSAALRCWRCSARSAFGRSTLLSFSMICSSFIAATYPTPKPAQKLHLRHPASQLLKSTV